MRCGICREPTHTSPSNAEKRLNGSRPAPLCLDCKSPARAAEMEAEAVRFVELLGDSAEDLARAVAAMVLLAG